MARPTAAPSPELNTILTQVENELVGMIVAGQQGKVTVHFGNQKLRVEVQKFLPEMSTKIEVNFAAG